MNSHQCLEFIKTVQKQERGKLPWRVLVVKVFSLFIKASRLLFYFSKLFFMGIRRRGPDVYGFYRWQMVMQTYGRSLPALWPWCTLPIHAERKGWVLSITYHHLVPSNEVWGLTQKLHIWYCHCAGLLTNQNGVVQLGIPSCHWWDQVLALDRKECHYHSPQKSTSGKSLPSTSSLLMGHKLTWVYNCQPWCSCRRCSLVKSSGYEFRLHTGSCSRSLYVLDMHIGRCWVVTRVCRWWLWYDKIWDVQRAKGISGL